jgi:hypothetical protein
VKDYDITDSIYDRQENPDEDAPYFEQVQHGPVTPGVFENHNLLMGDLGEAEADYLVTRAEAAELRSGLSKQLGASVHPELAWRKIEAKQGAHTKGNVVYVDFGQRSKTA